MKIAWLFWQLLRYRVAIMLILFLLLSVALHADLAAHPWKLLFAALALALSYISATSVNDIADYKIDLINHPANTSRPLVTGEAKARDVRLIFLLSSSLSLIFAAAIGWRAALIMSISILINVTYSLPPLRLSYRTFLAPLALGVAYVGIPYLLGLLVIGRLSISGRDWLWLLGLYLMFVGRIILKDFRDRKGDARYKKPTFLLRFGKNATCGISLVGISSGGLIIAWLVRDKFWLTGIVMIYLVSILIMLRRLKHSYSHNEEQLSIGVGAKMGNGLLITLLGVVALDHSGAASNTQITFGVAILALYLVNYLSFLRFPQKTILGYKG